MHMKQATITCYRCMQHFCAMVATVCCCSGLTMTYTGCVTMTNARQVAMIQIAVAELVLYTCHNVYASCPQQHLGIWKQLCSKMLHSSSDGKLIATLLLLAFGTTSQHYSLVRFLGNTCSLQCPYSPRVCGLHSQGTAFLSVHALACTSGRPLRTLHVCLTLLTICRCHCPIPASWLYQHKQT